MKKDMQSNIYLDDQTNLILKKLEDSGYEAFVVGGYVRDAILGNIADDVDVTTNASPNQIQEVFKDFTTVDIGSDFGTITVVVDKKSYEITTYRLESSYIDGRHPDKVEFTRDILEDLKRRDFTINAMAYNPSRGLIDFFGGIEDLNNKVLKTVGDPRLRFEEDYLRMLRAIRFATRFNLDIEEKVFEAIKDRASNIQRISNERINVEFSKILLTDYPVRGMTLLHESGLLKYILPDLDKCVGFDQKTIHHKYDVFEHSMKVLENTSKDLELRLAAICHDIGKIYTMHIGDDGMGHFYGHDKVSQEIAQRELRRLRYDNKTFENVSILVGKHMSAMNPYTEKSIKRLIRNIGEANTRKLLELQRADILATNNPSFTENIDVGEMILEKIISEEGVVFRSQLAINGNDLLKMGYHQGRHIGEILEKITDLISDNELENDRQKILEYINERTFKDEKSNNCRFMFRTK